MEIYVESLKGQDGSNFDQYGPYIRLIINCYKHFKIQHRSNYMKIKGICKSYNPTSKRCNLCLTEKLEILDDPELVE